MANRSPLSHDAVDTSRARPCSASPHSRTDPHNVNPITNLHPNPHTQSRTLQRGKQALHQGGTCHGCRPGRGPAPAPQARTNNLSTHQCTQRATRPGGRTTRGVGVEGNERRRKQLHMERVSRNRAAPTTRRSGCALPLPAATQTHQSVAEADPSAAQDPEGWRIEDALAWTAMRWNRSVDSNVISIGYRCVDRLPSPYGRVSHTLPQKSATTPTPVSGFCIWEWTQHDCC